MFQNLIRSVVMVREVTVKRHLLVDMIPLCTSGISADLTDSGQVLTTVSAAKPVTLVPRAG